jgi:beta-galactosidase
MGTMGRILAAAGIIAMAAALLPAYGGVTPATRPGREMLLFDAGWKFHFGHAADPSLDFGYGTGTPFAKAGQAVGAADPKFNDTNWRTVNLPHDWVVGLPFVKSDDEDVMAHGFKPVGRQFTATTIGWYRRAFEVAADDTGRRFVVRFDGVFRDCVVWVNGHYIGRNLSGYTGFNFDITDYLGYGRKNVIVVRVDASQYEGWFYEGAGIYRHVWLIKHDPVHVPEYGVVVRTENLAGEDRFGPPGRPGRLGWSQAQVAVSTDIRNESDVPAGATLSSRVIDPDGKPAVESGAVPFTLASRETQTLTQVVVVDKPKAWSLAHPALYTLVTLIRRDGRVLDSVATTFGIRTVVFDKDSGLFINNEHVKIQGVCCHQDHAGVGSALPDRLQSYRIERLKEMGANAYRTSHNPPTPELLEACDRLGMLVLDETRLMGTSPEFEEEFRKLILRDRNHPSVILWSIGNEEYVIQNTDVGERFARRMIAIQRSLDPTRLSTYAGNNGNHFEGINSVVPVRGFNYMTIADIDQYRREHPGQILLGTEEASTVCTRGVYRTDTVAGYLEDHDVNKPGWGSTAERWWSFYAARPWLAGGFAWTGFDYRGEPTPYGWPCINSHFGIMDACGFPKNNFYYYKAWWTDEAVLQISPHWNLDRREGDSVEVWCNTNCERVELFLNGTSLGSKTTTPNSHLEWAVPFRKGVLEAKGERRGKTYRTKVETTGPAKEIALLPDRKGIAGDGEDVVVFTVLARDASGREVPDADQQIDFTLDGPGRIIGVGNGDPSSHEADARPDSSGWGRRLFNGKCQVIVQSKGGAGKIVLRASSPGLARAEIRITASDVAPKPSVPVWSPVILKHLGFGKKAVYKTDYSARYPGTGLLDGVTGTSDFRDGAWQGFEGNDLDVTVDLGSSMPVKKVTLGVLSENPSWIFLPAAVDVYVSVDGAEFREAGSVSFEPPAQSEPAGVKRVPVETGGKKVRYVRVVAKSRKTCPAWHRGAGQKAWLFVDEVVIE